MEDKVKDQLDAANPEPIIEEVVSKNIFFQTIYFKLLKHFLSSGFGQPRSKKTRLVSQYPKLLLLSNLWIQITLACSYYYCIYDCRDLKRDVAKKLEKLERRTQRAIAELIR